MEQYVHRDVEPKHLGKTPDGALCLIDMGSCAPLIWETSDQASTSQTSGHTSEAPTQSYYSGMCHTCILWNLLMVWDLLMVWNLWRADYLMALRD